jgi:hypothetical protein
MEKSVEKENSLVVTIISHSSILFSLKDIQ